MEVRMTKSMRAYIFGIATVVVTLTAGFAGGALIADWLSDSSVPKQSRIEKVKETDGDKSKPAETKSVETKAPETTGSAAAAQTAANATSARAPRPEKPVAQTAAAPAHPLAPKPVTTETISLAPQTSSLPLN